MTYERMLTVEEAQKTVLDSISVAGIERRGLSDTREYILAEDIAPKYDVPPFNNSLSLIHI